MATNHRTNTPHHVMEFIYLRYTVVLVYGVYKYTTVDINTPYRRFKLILWWFFAVIYVVYATDFLICIYRYMSTVFYICIYTYISHPYFYTYIHSYIDTYICFFKALHIDHTRVHHELHDRHP